MGPSNKSPTERPVPPTERSTMSSLQPGYMNLSPEFASLMGATPGDALYGGPAQFMHEDTFLSRYGYAEQSNLETSAPGNMTGAFMNSNPANVNLNMAMGAMGPGGWPAVSTFGGVWGPAPNQDPWAIQPHPPAPDNQPNPQSGPVPWRTTSSKNIPSSTGKPISLQDI